VIRTRYKPEEIVAKLRQVDVMVSRKISRGHDDEQRLTADIIELPSLWLSHRGAPSPNGLDNQRQAGRAYLAT
jgi:hypothetical protein